MTDFLNMLAQWAAAAWPTLSSILAAVVALGLLVFAHELGHFLVAKLAGVGVLKFSLGFGRKLVGRKIGETEYMISAFPLGGYVKMLGEDEEGGELSPEQKMRSFLAQPIYKRAAIVFAGPLFNVLLAVLLCYVLFVSGFPTAIAKVAEVVPASPAQTAGFMRGDVVEKVNDEYMDTWEGVARYVKSNPSKPLSFSVKRGEKSVELKVPPAGEGGVGALGLLGSVVIEAVVVNSPADKGGILPRDRVVAVDGRKVGSWEDMAETVKANPGREIEFTVERDGSPVPLKVTPAVGKDGKDDVRIGVVSGTEFIKVAYGPVESVGYSVRKTYQMTEFTVALLGRLIKGKEDASQIGGPVAIVQMSGSQARRGFVDFVLFMAILSVNLGIINLFPVPILDGGHLMFFGLEAVMRKPLSVRMREVAQQIGLFLLIALTVFVFYNDIMRLLGLSEMWK